LRRRRLGRDAGDEGELVAADAGDEMSVVGEIGEAVARLAQP